ncbi:phosphoribosylformylglycinamidine synthase [Patescibacteria group bacterium]|jgi:phosphoribosylformylglycinamidine synthase|nr:phosphoribosylformylglycinamidine synthase [Patescibacteria group bacterium]
MLLNRYRLIDSDAEREYGFYIEVSEGLTADEEATLDWLLSETFEPHGYGRTSFLKGHVFEVGPRLNFETADSSTAVDICRACGLDKVTRLERSIRTLEPFAFDRMTHMVYALPPESLRLALVPEASFSVDVLGEFGYENLVRFSGRFGCGFDESDLTFLLRLYREVEKRDPTDVELFQIAQANSEHSRHHRFGGVHAIDGVKMPHSPFDLIKLPWKQHPGNSVLAFADDASAIRGREVELFVPSRPGQPSGFLRQRHVVHPTNKAETHNHPSMIAPFPGAETGVGGELRDRMSVGRGGQVGMSAAGYFVGALKIPGYALPCERDAVPHPSYAASPLDILIQASNGVSAYGNCFGDPVTGGVCRSFAAAAPDGRHYAWHKPIVYVGGAGRLRDQHLHKQAPEAGMLIVQLGGPGYRIGVGGGAASSILGGANDVDLDFKSVQRGAPQMEQRMYRVIRACVELGDKNPFVSTHDLGAGGLSNAVPELVHPAGGRVQLREIPCGDASLSILELWGNEAQEREVVLVQGDRFGQLEAICAREGCPVTAIGSVTGDGRITLEDADDTKSVDLPLEDILGSLPKKSYADTRQRFETKSLELPADLTVRQALERVLRLVSVGSKGFLVHKVDRSVGGLVAQQQCVGPSQLPLADFAILADGYFDASGAVHALGEQPIAGLLSPGVAARLAMTEAILNMAGACIETENGLDGIKASANWMLAAKKPGRNAWLYDACEALSTFCVQLGCALDGGKDSLSMAAGDVESPPTVIIKAYASMPDVARKATPDLKREGSSLLHISLNPNVYRLGGSALAQTYGQFGDDPPDAANADLLKRVFGALQDLVRDGHALAMHDVSDGGLIATLLEMAFAGHQGIEVELFSPTDAITTLFSQEPGVVVEVADAEAAQWYFTRRGIGANWIGKVIGFQPDIIVKHNGFTVLHDSLIDLRAIWSETSYQLERLQINPECADEEREAVRELLDPPAYRLTYHPQRTAPDLLAREGKPKVAVIRAEGSNGDREMAVAFHLAGFEPWDVTMSDLLEGTVGLDEFRGVVFVGGFSFADVFDSAKGWAGVIRFNPKLRGELERFRARPDTFSLGICNGCQLLALLGWVPGFDLPSEHQPRFVHNRSGRFESRFSTLRIEDSPALMLKGMLGSVLGCWVAHGEGRLHVPSRDVLENIVSHELVVASYANPETGMPTDEYPFNPNGSALNAAGLCSPDGRHLALMPHPERLVLPWQWPWMPDAWREYATSPWLRMFQNARIWCEEHPSR